LEHTARDPDDAPVLSDLDPELDGLLLGVPVGVLGGGMKNMGPRIERWSDRVL
jgi:hypothetical protein